MGLKGMPAEKALMRLQAFPQKGSEFLRKTIQQAIANAKNNLKLNQEDLVVKAIEVGEGPVFKRMDRSHGARFDRGIIRKKTSHIFLTLEAKEEKSAVVKKATKKKVEKKE